MLRTPLLYLSHAAWARRFITRFGLARRTAGRFVAGETPDDAIRAIQALNKLKIDATLDHLGESVTHEAAATRAADDYAQVLDRINAAGVRANVSIKLTQFEDFQCPFCLRYTSADEPTIVEEYVKTGKVQLIYEHFPGLGFESVRAAGAAQCAADQNLFWKYQNLLFLTQAKAGQLDNEKLQVDRFSDDNLKGYASRVGADRAKFDACVDSDTHITLVQDQQRRARSLGITGTPGFLINGQPFGAGAPGTLEGWRKLLDDAGEQIAKAANATPSASASPAASASTSVSPAVTASPAAAATPQPTATR